MAGKSKKKRGGNTPLSPIILVPRGSSPPAHPSVGGPPPVNAAAASGSILMGGTAPAPELDSVRVDSVNSADGQQLNSGHGGKVDKIGKFGNKSKHDDGTSVSTWSSLFKDNRSSTLGARLKKVTNGITKEKIIFHDSEFDDDSHVSRSLIGFFSPKFPGSDALLSLAVTWKHKCTIARHTTLWIVFTFLTNEDAWSVLEGGPYMSFGSVLHLREMPKLFNFGREQQRTIPVWAQLHNLPLELWSPKHLAKLCSFIGQPLHTDQLTFKMEHISFARCLVEIDVNADLPTHLAIDLPGGATLSQPVLYENKPLCCEKCRRLGHVAASCRDSGEPTLYVMRKPLKKVDIPAMKPKKKVNPASAPTDVWVEVGKKKATPTKSATDTVGTFGDTEVTPPPGRD